MMIPKHVYVEMRPFNGEVEQSSRPVEFLEPRPSALLMSESKLLPIAACNRSFEGKAHISAYEKWLVQLISSTTIHPLKPTNDDSTKFGTAINACPAPDSLAFGRLSTSRENRQ